MSLPTGFRFHPTEKELLLHYLFNKVMKRKLSYDIIPEVDLYRYNPEDLAEMYRSYWEKELYLFTHRDRKSPNGRRPNRFAGDGYWRASSDKKIFNNNEIVGCKRSLVFYKGKPPKGQKTNWIMHEYVLNESSLAKGTNLDEWVLCKIHERVTKSNAANDDSRSTEDPILASNGTDLSNNPLTKMIYSNGDSTGDSTLACNDGALAVDESNPSAPMIYDNNDPLTKMIYSNGDSTGDSTLACNDGALAVDESNPSAPMIYDNNGNGGCDDSTNEHDISDQELQDYLLICLSQNENRELYDM